MVEFNKEAITEIIDLGRLEPFFLVFGPFHIKEIITEENVL